MNIDLYLYASLAKYLPESAVERHASVGVKQDASVRDLVRLFNVPEKEIKLVFINGIKKDLDTRLNENDRVGLFPPVGGG